MLQALPNVTQPVSRRPGPGTHSPGSWTKFLSLCHYCHCPGKEGSWQEAGGCKGVPRACGRRRNRASAFLCSFQSGSRVQELRVPVPGQERKGHHLHQPLPSKLFSLPFPGSTTVPWGRLTREGMFSSWGVHPLQPL